MRKSFKSVMKMNNAVDAATSSYYWGKHSKHYSGVAGKGGCTNNFEIKDSDKKEA